MAYQELIKNFDKIRSYMRDFYVYGFKTRMDYDQKSSRSYDDERRRIESWLGDYMYFCQDTAGKRVFLSADGRRVPHNPLYKAFKTCSFTDNDITLHFFIMDLLADGDKRSGREILDELSEYLSCFDAPLELDESTIRKKLKEYEKLGLLQSEKRGREVFWSRIEDGVDQGAWRDAIAFYSEAAPLGVIGSYLLDKPGGETAPFSFKHHYLTQALNSEVLYEILAAMQQKRRVELTTFSPGNAGPIAVFPLRVYISTQDGRESLMAWRLKEERISFFRLDHIRKVKPCEVETSPEPYIRKYEESREKIWGISLGNLEHTEHIEMVIFVDRGEEYIIRRLEREKRCGHLERLDDYRFRLTADVYDANEMIPWIRTFLGRIQAFYCSNPKIEKRFRSDLEAMWDAYEGDGYAVQ